jgi:hypothetical protein
MGMLSKRGIRMLLLTAALMGVLIAGNAVPGVATPGSDDFVSKKLGSGLLSEGRLNVKAGLHVVVVQNTVQPGATSGWHSHPGGAIVVVQKGQITTYRSAHDGEGEDGEADGRCIKNTYTAGQAFIERPGEPLNARNGGPGETIIFATFPGVPLDAAGKTAQRTDEPNPGTCPPY